MSKVENNEKKKKFRNFLYKLINKKFLVFLFFFAVSGVFWLAISLREPMEREILIPVQIANVPPNVMLINDGIDTLRVMVRDNGYNLMGYYFDNKPPITVDFGAYHKGDGHGVVPASEVVKLIKSRMESSTQVLTVKPEKIDIYYNYGDYKKVPVEMNGNVAADARSFIVSKFVSPDSVTIYATSDELKQISSIKTQYFNITGVIDHEKKKIPLQKINGVKCLPHEVTLDVRADVLTEGSVEVPIEAVGVPEDKVLRTLPSSVRIKFATGANLLNHMDVSQFTVVVNYDEIAGNETANYLKLQLTQYPSSVKNPVLSIGSVKYLVEDKRGYVQKTE